MPERPATIANRDDKPWTLEAVVHEVRNALVPARHHLTRGRTKEPWDAIQRVLDMAQAIDDQLRAVELPRPRHARIEAMREQAQEWVNVGIVTSDQANELVADFIKSLDRPSSDAGDI